MRFRLVLSAVLLAWAVPVAAQKTEDDARLIFTMGLAYTGGTDLWAVSNQPILAVPGPGFDELALARDVSGGVGIVFDGMYFPKKSLGFVGEIFFTGIGVKDACAVTSPAPDPESVEVCSTINGASKSSSAVLVSVGPVYRVGADQALSPYVRAQAGVLVSNISPIEMRGAVVEPEGEFQVVIYDDPSNTRVTPGFVFGGGFTTPIGKGWQLRAEVRDNLVQIATVAGPTAPGIYEPEIVNEWKNLWSVVIAADLVLEKKRGKRY